MRKILISLFAVLWLSQFALADEVGGKFGIGVKGGVANYYGDLSENSFGVHYDFSIDYWLNDWMGLALNYGKNQLKAEEGTRYFESDLYNYSIHLRLNLLPSSNLNPYLIAGYEWFDGDPKDKNGNWLSEFGQGIRSGDYKRVNNAVPMGLGFSYFLSNAFSLDFEGLLHYSFIDYIDGYAKGSKDDNWISLAAGISLHLGKPKDTDKDGIPDRIDKDPMHAEDFDNFQDEDGVPDLDNDRDGVPDQIDKAPLDPEDRDKFQDEDGVPDPDNDNDGILDVNDQAPNAAEDMDGFQDNDGIPDPDNDQDGILDINDKCPDAAETMNGYEDSDGCPDEKPEVVVEKGQAIVLEGVTFATGSANLTENSKTILGKVVRTMTKNPDLMVEVRGFTDNTGSYSGNLKISQRRADAVKYYLVAQGLESSRITTQGFGPENPIAPNDTREGRAKNRRIEFFRVR